MEAGGHRVVVELGVHLLEIPGVLQLDVVQHDLRLRGDTSDVGLDALGKVLVGLVVDDVQFVNRQFLLLDEPDRGPPGVPTRLARAAVRVLLCAKNRYYCRFHGKEFTIFPRRIPRKKDSLYNFLCESLGVEMEDRRQKTEDRGSGWCFTAT